MLKAAGLITGLLVATTGVAGEEETICQTAGLIVIGETAEARDRICQISAREVPKLAACNVAVPNGVTIEFEDDLPEGCMSVFYCGEVRIDLLPPDLMAKRRALDRAFADVPDEPFFDSVVVHELTHAAYDTVTCPFTDCVVTAEYAAFVMQVRSLPPDSRGAFEMTSTFDRRIAQNELSATYLKFAPDHFAQKAWLHFTQRNDGCKLMKEIMDGAVFFDREHF